MRWILFSIIFMLPSVLWAPTSVTNPPLNITEEDGSPSTYPYKAKFSNGTVTDNGDGTVSISNSGSGGSSSLPLPAGATNYIQNTSTPTISTQEFKVLQGEFSEVGYVMTDSDSCRWRTTINTSGALVTALIECPAGPAPFLPCTTGMSKGLLLAITCSES